MQASKPISADAEPHGRDEVRADFRKAMARLGAAVHIVTTDGPGGKAGFSATAVCSVSDDPPTLLVCLNKSSSAYDAVKTNGVLCVNLLSSDHIDLSRTFGGRTPADERFRSASWHLSRSGCPSLADALVSFDCRIASVTDGFTHDVLLCEVLETRSNNAGRSLIYLNRSYHAL